MQQTYFTAQVAEKFGTTATTVYRWSESLEAAGYHYLRDDRGQRAYREIDVEALARLIELKDGKRMKVETAARKVVEEFADRVEVNLELLERRPEIVLPDTPEEFMKMIQNITSAYHEVVATNEQLASELAETKEEMQLIRQQLQALPEASNQLEKKLESLVSTDKLSQDVRAFVRTSQFDLRFLELEVSKELRKQALDEWGRLPESERYIKSLFSKRENMEKRHDFISRYVEERLPEEMKKRLNT
ncbi:MerR family transcriptional regulator [Paenibacillus chitinolyticus]